MDSNLSLSRRGLRSISAAAAYTLGTYLVAFAVGAIRVILVAPRVGPVLAVLLEAPVVLFAAWRLSAWSIRKFGVEHGPRQRLLMGAISFALLMAVESGVAHFAFGRSASDQLSGLASAAGIIGLATQLCFAAIPAVQLRWS